MKAEAVKYGDTIDISVKEGGREPLNLKLLCEKVKWEHFNK